MLTFLFLLLAASVFRALSTGVEEPLPSDKHDALEIGWWSPWSPWTTCSRSCDGGITLSLRTCSSSTKSKRSRCIGEPIRRRICNTMACSEPTYFRGSQCSAYNFVPYRGRLYQWLPFYDPDDPCTLTCQAKDYNFVAKLSTKVQDGTRCREGALDMCVQGRCKSVGCDLEVGSTMKVDDCGVCGGDSSTCMSAPVFVWAHRPFGPCPVTCGGGFQLSEAVCLQKESQQHVDNMLCDLSLKPRSQTNNCNNFTCPVVWLAGEWSPCSATCGTGIQTRGLQCVQGGPNGTQLQISKEFCPHHKPEVERTCTVQECPRWFQGSWSACSTTCGSGVQRRAVVCRDDRGHYSENCDETTKPEMERECGMKLSCPETPSTTEPPPCVTEGVTYEEIELYTDETLAPVPPDPYTFPTPDSFPSVTTTEKEKDEFEITRLLMGYFHTGPWGPCTVTCGTGKRRRLVHCQIVIGLKITILPDTQCTGLRPTGVEACTLFCEIPSTTSTIAATTASTTTTTATTTTTTVSTIAATIAITDTTTTTITATVSAVKEDEEFTRKEDKGDGENRKTEQHLKKEEEEEEEEEIEEDLITTTAPSVVPKQSFVWKTPSGELYSPCAIVCQKGGGLESQLLSRVVCSVRQAEGSELTESTVPCEKPTEAPKPKSECDDVDCISIAPYPKQPRWKVGEYSECSVSCGGGWRTRTVRCVSQRNDNEDLPFQRCLGPQPLLKDSCNVVDCPPQWKAEPWSECSKSCGGGFQTRKLRCDMDVIHPPGTTLQLPLSRCTRARPKANKPCNRKPCLKSSSSIFEIPSTTVSTTKFDNGVVRHLNSRRVTIRAEGKVSVFRGATIKVHCPSEHGNLSSVLWFKGRQRITIPLDPRRKSVRRVSVLPRGSLRIRKVNMADSATYSCLMGHFRSDFYLFVRALPPEGFSAQSEKTHEVILTSEYTSHPISITSVTTSTSISSSSSQDLDGDASRPRMKHYLINPSHEKFQGKEDSSIPSFDSQRQQQSYFSWKIGSWSHCSETCGTNGVQIRSLECVVRLRDTYASENNNTKLEEASPVANSMCHERKLLPPETTRACHMEPCPEWMVGPWSPCSATNCVSWNTAYQKREIKCKGNYQFCNENRRPRRKRECFQPKCKSLWKIGGWSECTLTCGESGVRMRKVECVWYGSGLQAGAHSCKDTPQPESIATCKGPPCSQPVAECVNQSTYCEVVKSTKLCRVTHFRLQCCASCASETPDISEALEEETTIL